LFYLIPKSCPVSSVNIEIGRCQNSAEQYVSIYLAKILPHQPPLNVINLARKVKIIRADFDVR